MERLTDRPLYSRFGAEIAKQLAAEAGATDTSTFPDGRLTRLAFCGVVDVEQIGRDLYREGWDVSTEAIRQRLTPEDVVDAARERVQQAHYYLRCAEEVLAFVEEWASVPSQVLPNSRRPDASSNTGNLVNDERPGVPRRDRRAQERLSSVSTAESLAA